MEERKSFALSGVVNDCKREEFAVNCFLMTQVKNYMRLSQPTFYSLLEKIKPKIEKQDTVMRTSISAGARLEATHAYCIIVLLTKQEFISGKMFQCI